MIDCIFISYSDRVDAIRLRVSSVHEELERLEESTERLQEHKLIGGSLLSKKQLSRERTERDFNNSKFRYFAENNMISKRLFSEYDEVYSRYDALAKSFDSPVLVLA